MIVQQIEWRRLYRHEPLQQRTWDFAARGLRDMLIRIPETLDGIVLEQTDDPVEDLLVALSIKPKDKRDVSKAIKGLLSDGYLVHENRVLWIRNFEQAQTGHDQPTDHAAPRPPSAPSKSHPDLSAIRAAAGAKGGKRSAAARQANGDPEQATGQAKPVANSQAKPEANQANQANQPEAKGDFASTRDPEDQRREENRREESSNISSNPTVQVLGRAGDPQAKLEANGQAKPCARDVRTMAERFLNNRGSFIMDFGDSHTWPEVQDVCKAFEETWGRKDAPPHGGDIRARRILERLAEGIPVERLVLAVRRSKFAPAIANEPSHQTLITILRDAAQVDKFCALAGPPRKAGERGPKQPEGGEYKLPVERRS